MFWFVKVSSGRRYLPCPKTATPFASKIE